MTFFFSCFIVSIALKIGIWLSQWQFKLPSNLLLWPSHLYLLGFPPFLRGCERSTETNLFPRSNDKGQGCYSPGQEQWTSKPDAVAYDYWNSLKASKLWCESLNSTIIDFFFKFFRYPNVFFHILGNFWVLGATQFGLAVSTRLEDDRVAPLVWVLNLWLQDLIGWILWRLLGCNMETCIGVDSGDGHMVLDMETSRNRMH